MSCCGMLRRLTRHGSPNDTRRVVRSWARAAGLPPPFPCSSLAVGAARWLRSGCKGDDDGSHVWFDPIGVLIKPGQTVHWTNLNPGNSHTTTAYNPANFERPLRMPKAAKSWDSDYLLPNESFSVTFTEQGVYDYYCIPHEHAGNGRPHHRRRTRSRMAGLNWSARMVICQRWPSRRFRWSRTS